jgi:hypothetical protein
VALRGKQEARRVEEVLMILKRKARRKSIPPLGSARVGFGTG